MSRTAVFVVLFAALVGFALLGDARGWFDTPVIDLGADDGGTAGPDLAGARATCRFGTAIARAATRGKITVPLRDLADTYAGSFRGLSSQERVQIRDACLQGLRRGLRDAGGGPRPRDD